MASCRTMLAEHWPEILFSSLYKTAPREWERQDPFLNAVARLETDDTPEEIAEILSDIEKTLKKDPPFKFGPRTIDLDLLLYDDLVTDTNDLALPHPRMHERRFVLEPLSELIVAEEKHPIIGKTWKELLAKVQDQECEKME